MKRYTTRFLKFVALFYMAFPASYLLAAALLFDISPQQCVRVLLSPWYYVLSTFAILTGYGFWEMKRWAWYVFLLTNVLIGYNNALLVTHYGDSNHKAAVFVVSILVIVFIMLRVAREVRVPYFLPRIRWWESDPRYKLSVPVTINEIESKTFTGEILDLSMGGCFIKLRAEIPQDSRIGLKFTCFGQTIEIVGIVVWHTQSAVTHPQGIGIKFNPPTRPQKRVLKAVTQRLKAISNLYRTSRYLMNQEEFERKMTELQKGVIDMPASKGA